VPRFGALSVNDDLGEDFAELLRSAVDSYGLPQAEIARACGVTQQTVSRWLASGPTGDRVAYAKKLTDLLEHYVASAPDGTTRQDASELAAFLEPLGGIHLFELPPLVDLEEFQWWRDEDLDVLNFLSRYQGPLSVLDVHPGHGATTAARRLERNRIDLVQHTFVVPVRVGVERLVAWENSMSEVELYQASAFGAPSVARRLSRRVVDLSGALEELVLESISSHLDAISFDSNRPLFEDAMRTRSWRQIFEVSTEPKLHFILDLSPSPLFRTETDEVDAGFVAIAQEVIEAVANLIADLPHAIVTVIQSDVDPNLERLIARARSKPGAPEPETRSLAARRRADLLEILARRAGKSRDAFSLAISPRLLYDPALGSLARCARQTRRTIAATLAAIGDPGGVIQSSDLGAADSASTRRLDDTGALTRAHADEIARLSAAHNEVSSELAAVRAELQDLRNMLSAVRGDHSAE
jgi:transcriptional regulator with XRE-family HTH domain